MSSDVSRLVTQLNALSEWIEMQKTTIETFKDINSGIGEADRLTLVLLIRKAFDHVMRTVREFDKWLENPLVLSYIDREMLQEVWSSVYEILVELLELDIKHTTLVRDNAIKMLKSGKIPPVIMEFRRAKSEEEETREAVRRL
ncbi:MAG: DUF2153 family protein [Sulfolobales archaeon]|nr:DUF2153 domain-containing protein [Sulfolobales archaeon]MDW8082421.1 DUF2153 family protein [Sulfolobales archaeon]